MGRSHDYGTAVGNAQASAPLITAGNAASMPELAIRYAISNPVLSTTEIGIATLEELQGATDAVNKGPLAQDALAQIKNIQTGFAA